MKRFLLLAAFFLAPALCWGQQTTITATVTDPLGRPYTFLTGNASIQCPGNQQPTFNGSPLTRTISITGGNGFGQFTQVLWDVNAIQPTGCSWRWAITWSDGVTNFITGNIGGVTGPGPVNLSAAISAFSVPLPPSAGSVLSVFATAPIVATPNPIISSGTISCPTCTTTTGIGGTISNGQIAVGSGVNTIGGSAALTFLTGFLELASSTGMDITDTSAGTGLTLSISGGGTGKIFIRGGAASNGIGLENDGTGGSAGITLNNTTGGGGTAIIDNTATGMTLQSTGSGGIFEQANSGAGGITLTTAGGTGPLAFATNGTGGLTINGSPGVSHASSAYTVLTLTNGIVTAATPATGLSPVLKKGTNAGNYQSATGSFAAVDGTNLALTTNIPVGINLIVHANGSMSPNGGTSSWFVALFDGGSKLDEQTLTWTAAGASNSCPASQNCGAESFALQYLIVGDGASHTIQLEYAADGTSFDTSGRILNSGGVFPTMIFTFQ